MSSEGKLIQPSEEITIHPLANLEDFLAKLPSEETWGFYTTATEACLLRAPRARWEEIARRPTLQELRVFNDERDLHWLGDRGVELAVIPTAPEGSAQHIGGPGWVQRDRRSRLWGEALEGTATWYEERIPDPLRYEGLDPGSPRYAFLIIGNTSRQALSATSATAPWKGARNGLARGHHRGVSGRQASAS